MKYLLALLILIAQPAFAETYEKVDNKTIAVVKHDRQEINIDAVKSNRQSLQDSCTAQLAEYDALISEAQSKGVA